MDIKQLIKSKNLDIKSLSQNTRIPYSTLNDFVNGKTSIYKMQFGNVKRIAESLEISIEDLEKAVYDDRINSDYGDIIIKNKRYYLKMDKFKEPFYLCKVNEFNKDYVKTLAEWEYEYQMQNESEEKWKNNLL